MPCLECGCKMEIVDEEWVEVKGEGWVNEISYECPGCGNETVVLDAE